MHHDTNFTLLQAACSQTDSFGELVSIALTELNKFTNGCGVVCGPISTGGRGNPEANLEVFLGTIAALRSDGHPIFSQEPYEERIFFFRDRWRTADATRKNQYYMPILDEFYTPLFGCGVIKDAWFISGWETSFGACWERQRLLAHGVKIHDLTFEWTDRIIAGA